MFCCAQPVKVSYSVESSCAVKGLVDYELVAKNAYYLNQAKQHEEDGNTGKARWLRKVVGESAAKFQLLPPDEKIALQRLWAKIEISKSMSLHFGLGESTSGKAEAPKRAVISISIVGYSEDPGDDKDYVVDDLVGEICKFHDLKELRLRNTVITEEALTKLASQVDLDYFDAPANLSDKVLAVFLKAVSSLKYLELHGCVNIDGSFARDDGVGENLREITMLNTGLNPANLVGIMALPWVSYISLDGMNLHIKSLSKKVLERQ